MMPLSVRVAAAALRRGAAVPLAFKSSSASVSSTTVTEAQEAPARRALLYVPGHDARKIAKAAALEVDSVCMDCEDGVAANRKADARAGIVTALETVDFGGSERAVRINALMTDAAREDLAALFAGAVLPDCLVVPKVDTPEQLDWVGGVPFSGFRNLFIYLIIMLCLL
jgi:hypothetical protein